MANQLTRLTPCVSKGTRLAMAGVGIGLLGAFLATRLISSLLFGISSNDPLTFAAVAGTLTLAACAIPAFRASRVDPVAALRAE